MLELVTAMDTGFLSPAPSRREPSRPASARQDARPRDLGLRFEREVLPHFKALSAGACRMTRSRADAEDLVQETCLRAFRAFHLFEPGTNVRAWLFTILYRARADQYRKAARSPRTVELVHDGPSVAPPQERLARGQEAVTRALARVPAAFREAVVLRDMQDLTYQEIADVLGLPIGTVMSRIHRGRALLRELLQAQAA